MQERVRREDRVLRRSCFPVGMVKCRGPEAAVDFAQPYTVDVTELKGFRPIGIGAHARWGSGMQAGWSNPIIGHPTPKGAIAFNQPKCPKAIESDVTPVRLGSATNGIISGGILPLEAASMSISNRAR